MKKVFILSIFLAYLPTMSFAQEKPTSDEVRKVVQYYFNGKGRGAILMDYKLCQIIYKEGARKNECKLGIINTTIKKGQEVFLWLNFLVPVGDEAEVLLEYKRKNKVRKIQNISIPKSFRYRTWRKILTNKAGKWTINIFQETDDKDLDLDALEYSVVE
jgi:hypothetical protein